MRIASLNIAKKYGPQLVEEIARQPDLGAADILLLQEVVDGPSFHVAAEVAKALGLNVVFQPAFRLNAQFEEGIAILSRYPLGAPTVVPLPHNKLHFHTRIRIVLATTAESPSGPLRIVTTHLDNRINAPEKRAQIAGIWKATDGTTGPCIIGGDFNTGNFYWISHLLPIPGVQSLRHTLNAEMERQGFRTPLGSGPGTLHFMGLKLDWIYLRGLSARGSGVTPIPFSDHNSVWAIAER
jgi:endonuclease/exonuclease/phosphatase family metal-dependent hydrolase